MDTSFEHSAVIRRTVGEDEKQVATDAVLSALDDPDCRRILTVVASTPSTAAELIDRCELPSSTAYRKLDQLTEAELLEERTRIRADGNHVSEYVCGVSGVSLEFSADGIALTVDVGDDGNPRDDGVDADGSSGPTVPSY
jgi:DNA-binding transcriptional ArsR family regulator